MGRISPWVGKGAITLPRDVSNVVNLVRGKYEREKNVI